MKSTLTPSRNSERATTTRPMFTSGSGVANRLEGHEENMSLDYIDQKIIRTVREWKEAAGITLNDRHRLAKILDCSVDQIDAAIEFLNKRQEKEAA